MKRRCNKWPCFCLALITALGMPGLAAAQAGEQAPPAEEEMLTGAELLQNCRPEPAGAEEPTPYCMEFVYGLVQTLASLQEMMPEAEKIFCIDPNRIGLEEVTRRVTEWLETHPERLDEAAFLLASEALHENYPCPDSNVQE